MNKKKSVFLNLLKNGLSESLAVKATYFTHYVSYLNPEGEVDRFMGVLSSSLKCAWQAHVLSHSPVTMETFISFLRCSNDVCTIFGNIKS